MEKEQRGKLAIWTERVLAGAFLGLWFAFCIFYSLRVGWMP